MHDPEQSALALRVAAKTLCTLWGVGCLATPLAGAPRDFVLEFAGKLRETFPPGVALAEQHVLALASAVCLSLWGDEDGLESLSADAQAFALAFAENLQQAWVEPANPSL